MTMGQFSRLSARERKPSPLPRAIDDNGLNWQERAWCGIAKMPLSHMTGAKRRKSCSEKEDVWRKRLEKEKTPQGRLFDSFALSARIGANAYSHSIVAGGLPETSYTTREMPLISLMMRFET